MELDIERITEANLLRSEILETFVADITPILRDNGVLVVSDESTYPRRDHTFYIDVNIEPIQDSITRLAEEYRTKVGSFIRFPKGWTTWASPGVLKVVAQSTIKQQLVGVAL